MPTYCHTDSTDVIENDYNHFLSHVITFWRTTLQLSINNTKLKSEPIQIKRGIY
jgi:hypothetical protein